MANYWEIFLFISPPNGSKGKRRCLKEIVVNIFLAAFFFSITVFYAVKYDVIIEWTKANEGELYFLLFIFYTIACSIITICVVRFLMSWLNRSFRTILIILLLILPVSSLTILINSDQGLFLKILVILTYGYLSLGMFGVLLSDENTIDTYRAIFGCLTIIFIISFFLFKNTSEIVTYLTGPYFFLSIIIMPFLKIIINLDEFYYEKGRLIIKNTNEITILTFIACNTSSDGIGRLAVDKVKDKDFIEIIKQDAKLESVRVYANKVNI
jgi:hypothetical protein